MLIKTLLIVSFIFVSFAGFTSAQGKSLSCPKSTVYKRVKILPGRQEKTDYFARYEEFCRRGSAARGFFKQGPYKLWGPNGELVIKGQYINGKKEGKWKRWIPSQVIEELWKADKLVDSQPVEEPRSLMIDFEGCVKQSGTFYWAFGSTSYEVLGAEGRFCKIKYATEEENLLGFPVPSIFCRVPKTQRKVAVDVFFSGIKEFCETVKNGQAIYLREDVEASF